MTDGFDLIRQSAEVRAYFDAQFQATKSRLAAVIERVGLRPGLAAALAEARIAWLDEAMAPIYPAMAAAGKAVACAKGCGCCCTLTIDVHPDEVFALVDYLEAALDEAALAGLKRRAAEGDARAHGLDPITRHRLKIPCPVQDPATGACLGHAARPNACQGYLSLDLPKCLADHADPPQPVTQPSVAPVLTGMVAAARSQVLEAAGLAATELELTAALLAAWREPDAEARWLSGEAVFPDARSWSPPA